MTERTRAALSLPAPAPAGNRSATRAWVAHIMGLPISVHIRQVMPEDPAIVEAIRGVFGEIRRWDEIFSLWKPDSELCRLRRGELPLSHCSPDMTEVMDICRVAEEQTEGWFSAWTGNRHPTRDFDPTGVVKGMAVERSSFWLRTTGRDFSVNAGGDIVAWCHPAHEPWRFGIEHPVDRARVVAVVEMQSGGLATSGNAARGPHIRDPRTGALVTGLGSVSVWGPTLTWSDILATAGFASGPDHRWLAGRRGFGHLVTDVDGTVLPSSASAPASWAPDDPTRPTWW